VIAAFLRIDLVPAGRQSVECGCTIRPDHFCRRPAGRSGLATDENQAKRGAGNRLVGAFFDDAVCYLAGLRILRILRILAAARSARSRAARPWRRDPRRCLPRG
jgi:hypothetical protein